MGCKLSYREMAELLTAYSGVYVQKSNVWNTMHRAKRCPKPVRIGLERMGLMKGRPKRWRFFYEVPEERYKQIESFLSYEDTTFTEYMSKTGGPWEDKLHA